MKIELRCAVCHRRQPEVCGGFCKCGAYVWEPIPFEPPPGIVLESLEEEGSRLKPRHFSSLLSETPPDPGIAQAIRDRVVAEIVSHVGPDR